MLKKFSWIIASLALYFVGLAVYMLQDDRGTFWVNYFYTVNGYLICISLAYNLKLKKTPREMAVIMFVLVFRILLLLYFIIGSFIIGNVAWMNSNIMFLCVLGISGFIGILYERRGHYGTKL